ncbi:MAG: multiubiquitin domain-containing protein [Formivibrio sp.]|nr:multiubiquitin domain-containing protein [Formivibrio sp.]
MTIDNQTADAGKTPQGFAASVNGRSLDFHDPVPDVRQMLNAAEFMPADECILVQGFAHGTRAMGLDETVDLREPGIETFWAFRSDRVFRFTVDERGFEWGASTINEPMLRAIAHVKEEDALVLERDDHPDKVLGPDDEVDLAKAGTEHLRIKKRLVTVYFGIDDKPFHIPAGTYTTEDLIGIFPIEAGYLLNLLDDGAIVTLKPGQKIHVKDGMHFSSQPPGGASS